MIKQDFERETIMKTGDRIYTPRFCTVAIKEVLADWQEAWDKGYREPTHYDDPEWNIVGKSLDMYHMEFAAYRR